MHYFHWYGIIQFPTGSINYCCFIDLCILCLQLLYVLHSIIQLLRGGWDLCRQTVINRLLYCYLQPFTGRIQEILRFKKQATKPNPRPIAWQDPISTIRVYDEYPFLGGLLHITLKKNVVHFCFNYLFCCDAFTGRGESHESQSVYYCSSSPLSGVRFQIWTKDLYIIIPSYSLDIHSYTHTLWESVWMNPKHLLFEGSFRDSFHTFSTRPPSTP